MNIYDVQQNYDSLLHYHCLKNCLIQGIEYYGIPNAYLYIDVSCKFTLQENKLGCYTSDHSVARNNLWPIFKENLIAKRFDDDRLAEQYVSEVLKQNKIVIVATDTYYLPYQKSFNKYHGSHAIILTREYEDAFQIIDWYEPHYFKGLLNKEDLMKARRSENPLDKNPFSGSKIERETFILTRFTKKYEAKQVFSYGVKKVYKDFYEEGRSLISNTRLYGMNALKKIMHIIPEMLIKEGQRKINVQKIHNDLFLLFIARKLQAYYFRSALSFYSGSILISMNETYKELLSQYERILILVIRIGVKYQKEILDKVCITLNRIGELEETLGNYIGALGEELGGAEDEVQFQLYI